MENLKCKSCGGNLTKDGVVYICEKCGETFKESEIKNIQEETINNSQKPEDIASKLLSEGKGVIEVIKELRDRTGLGLAEAKSIVDTVMSNSSNIPNSTQQGGCYIATCVYGSYDCPEVWILRRYRDYKLDSTFFGKCFIKIYYAISPKLVKWFGNTKCFKKVWKTRLDKMVNNLREQGYSDTKYIDKNISRGDKYGNTKM